MSRSSRLGLSGVIVALIVAMDQWTKWLVLNTPIFNARACLTDPSACGRIEVSPIADLSMVWNFGMSYGMFQSHGVMRWVLVAVVVAIAAGFGVWLVRATRLRLTLALALIVGGAIGNMIDRVRFGAVVDFIDFSDIWFVYVFNVADAAVSIGAVLLFLDQYIMSRAEKKAGEGPTPQIGSARQNEDMSS